jgi:chaperonin cofactor prefoldin
MQEYNRDFFLQRLEKTLSNVEETISTVQADVKEIQINMAEFRHLGTLIPRIADVEAKAENVKLELMKLSTQFQGFKESVEKNKLGILDILKGSGALIAWVAAIVSIIVLLK